MPTQADLDAASVHPPGRGLCEFLITEQEPAMTRRQDNLAAPIMIFSAWFGCFAMMVLHFG
jgi:hypothetical protein